MQRIFTLAGGKFRPTFAQIANMELVMGDRVKLEREPDNQYDANAVKVLRITDSGTHHIGYVPAEFARDLSPMLYNQFAYTCTCVKPDSKSLKPDFLLDLDESTHIFADGAPV